MGDIEDLRAMARKAGLGVEIVHAGAGTRDASVQYRVHGRHLTVDWWPYSKRRSAYVLNTKHGVHNATPEDVIRMAREAPPAGAHSKRSQGKARSWKKSRYRKHAQSGRGHKLRCHWCPRYLAIDEATVDHRIPLHRGGLDNRNNFVIACEPCNQRRGHDMPEVG